MDKKGEWRGRALSARVKHMASILVNHPDFSGAAIEIRRRVKRAIRQGLGDLFGIVAATGGGKTTLANYFLTLWRDRVFPHVTWRRVLYFSVPPRPSSASMSSALLRALGDPSPDSGKTDVRKERVITLCKACRTRLVLIDNTQDIPERRAKKGIREVGNWIRDLESSVPALIVCLGEEPSLEVFSANRQVRRRGPAFKRLNYFVCDPENKEATKRFLRALYEIDLRLPLAQMSGLAEPRTAARIWAATNGIMGMIIKLLTEALEICVKDKGEAITQQHLAHAFELLMGDAAQNVNPFSEDFAFRALTEAGEPFHLWLEDGLE
jgi:hypothetical protein